MTSAYARTFVRTVGEVAGWGWGWSDWQFLRREIKLGNLRFSWREFWQWIELDSATSFLQSYVSISVEKSQQGREGSPRHWRCFSFWRKINHFRGNQRSLSSKNLNWRFLCLTYDKIVGNKFLRLYFLLGHAFVHAFVLLENCLPTFQLSFKIIVLLYCGHKLKYNWCLLFRIFKTELFIWFFVEESVASQWDSSMAPFLTVVQALTVDYRKNLSVNI